MKDAAKYLGVLVMIIGVIILAVPFFSSGITNRSLGIGLLFVLEGFLGFVYVNKLTLSKSAEIIWAIILLIIPYLIFRVAKKIAYPEEFKK